MGEFYPDRTDRFENFKLRRATLADFEDVLGVVQDAARRVQEKGITQWRLYLTETGAQRVLARVNAGVVNLARRDCDGRPIAAMSVEWSDREYWGDRGEDGLAGYVHMLSVHRRARGIELGARMMWFAERMIESNRRRLARLDCWAGSTFLPGYYERLGFRRVDQVGGPNGSLLMEKRVIE